MIAGSDSLALLLVRRTRRWLKAMVPALGALSLVFGVVYAFGAIGAAR